MNLPHYKLEIDDDKDSLGIEEVSYVEYPATGMGYLMFSEDKVQKNFAKIDKEFGWQRMTSGVLMMPNTKYLRVDSVGDYYTAEFSSETLKKAMLKYLKESKSDVVKYEHEVTLDGFKAIEHWIIEDVNTKSPILGFSLEDLGYDPTTIPVGTIMKTTYVENETFWNEQILTGKVRGYSLGGMFEMLPVETQEFKKVETDDTPDPTMLLEFLKTTNSKVTLKEGQDLTFSEGKVLVENELAEGDFTFKNGLTIVVKEGYIIDSGFLATEEVNKEVEQEVTSVLDEVLPIDSKETEDIIKDSEPLEETKEDNVEEFEDIVEQEDKKVDTKVNEDLINLKSLLDSQTETLNEFKTLLESKDNELLSLKEEFKKAVEGNFKSLPIKKNVSKTENTQVNSKIEYVEINVGGVKTRMPRLKK